MVGEMSAEEMPGEMTDGFHLVVEALKLNGVDTIYGVAGIPITDLLRLAQAEGIRYFGFRHEQSAGNAAAIAGYLTQKPGVCMTVSAPGGIPGALPDGERVMGKAHALTVAGLARGGWAVGRSKKRA